MLEHKVIVYISKNALSHFRDNEMFNEDLEFAMGGRLYKIVEEDCDEDVAIIVDNIGFRHEAEKVDWSLINVVTKYEEVYQQKVEFANILEQFEASLLQLKEYSNNEYVNVQGYGEYNIANKLLEIRQKRYIDFGFGFGLKRA